MATPPPADAPLASPTGWSYAEAFSRHQGLLAPAEQSRLQASRVAIAGLGGCGGVYLNVLARLGIGSFHLADPDAFEVVNFNRQHGATNRTVGQNKAQVMAAAARDINPELDARVFPQGCTSENVAAFLDGVDVVVDAIDFFSIDARRLLCRETRRRGIWVVFAAPLGCSAAWVVFSPAGMSFEDYFALDGCRDRIEQLVSFAVGLSPRATHLPYLDLGAVDVQSRRGPSLGLACNLCGGVIGAEVLKILLGWESVYPVPYYFQFDARRHLFRRGFIRWGNRHPMQRLKRWCLDRRVRRLGLDARVSCS